MVKPDIVQVANQVIMPLGACLVRCGALLTRGGTRGLLLLGATDSSVLLLYTSWQHHAFRVTYSKPLEFGNALKVGSSK